jgi:Tfp pilus assembly protein PilO
VRGLSPRERILVSLVIAAAVATVFYLFLWTPQTARRADLEARLGKQRSELARMQELAARREEKEREYQALYERLRLIEVKLPAEREIPRLIRQVQEAAAGLGVKLTLLRPGANQPGAAAARPGTQAPGQPAPARGQPAPAAEARYQVFALDLGFEGTYASLMAYLARLEDFPRLIILKQISMSTGARPQLKATLGAETYVLPREGPPQP